MRLLLCRPQGGLNDVLNQVASCYEYAKAHGRVLIVDTDYRNSQFFRAPFADYFTWAAGDALLRNPFSDAELDRMDAWPACLAGRVSSYDAAHEKRLQNLVDSQSREPLTFDFQRDHPHQLLVHQQWGGGNKGLSCLAQLRLQPGLLDALRDRLAQIPRPYTALHVRNTDMTADYAPAIREMATLNLPHLFLATDSGEVLDAFTRQLPATRISSFSHVPGAGRRPLHIDFDRAEAARRNSDAILDLVMLALARPLMLCKVNNNPFMPYSGFSLLAATLHKDQDVLRRLTCGAAG